MHCNLITIIIKDIQYVLKTKDEIFLFLQNWIFYIMGIIYSIKYIKKEKALSIYIIVSLLLFVTTCRNNNWSTIPSISLFRYVFGLFSVYLLVNTKDNKIIKNPIVISLYFTKSLQLHSFYCI